MKSFENSSPVLPRKKYPLGHYLYMIPYQDIEAVWHIGGVSHLGFHFVSAFCFCCCFVVLHFLSIELSPFAFVVTLCLCSFCRLCLRLLLLLLLSMRMQLVFLFFSLGPWEKELRFTVLFISVLRALGFGIRSVSWDVFALMSVAEYLLWSDCCHVLEDLKAVFIQIVYLPIAEISCVTDLCTSREFVYC